MPSSLLRSTLGPWYMRAAKPQRVRHDGYRTERHGNSREHGIEQDAKRRVQETRGNWNTNDVVDKRPEEVLFDRTHGAVRQIHGRRNPTYIAAHQGDIGCLHGHIGTGANGNTHVGPRQGRGVVDAVAYHGNAFACGLQLLDLAAFFFWQDLGEHVANPQFPTNGRSGALMIASEHHHLEPLYPQHLD